MPPEVTTTSSNTIPVQGFSSVHTKHPAGTPRGTSARMPLKVSLSVVSQSVRERFLGTVHPSSTMTLVYMAVLRGF